MAIFSYIKRLFFRTLQLPVSVDALIVGLGNSGPAYVSTRHNIGFRVVDTFSNRFDGLDRGLFGEADFFYGTLFSDKRVLAIKPRTLMNRSGSAIEKYLVKWQLPVSQMLVVVDDINLPLGKLRIREKGSDGGHNGMKSISSFCGEDFPRLRVGIGPIGGDKGPGTLVEFVLGKFTDAEEEQLIQVVPRAAEACELFIKSGINAAMSKYN